MPESRYGDGLLRSTIIRLPNAVSVPSYRVTLVPTSTMPWARCLSSARNRFTAALSVAFRPSLNPFQSERVSSIWWRNG